MKGSLFLLSQFDIQLRVHYLTGKNFDGDRHIKIVCSSGARGDYVCSQLFN